MQIFLCLLYFNSSPAYITQSIWPSLPDVAINIMVQGSQHCTCHDKCDSLDEWQGSYKAKLKYDMAERVFMSTIIFCVYQPACKLFLMDNISLPREMNGKCFCKQYECDLSTTNSTGLTTVLAQAILPLWSPVLAPCRRIYTIDRITSFYSCLTVYPPVSRFMLCNEACKAPSVSQDA